MASTYSDLKFELIGTGEQSGTWGVTTNTNLGTAIEEAITGSADVTFASGNVTLTLTNTNTTQAARNLRLNCTGTTGGARNLVVPTIEKFYLVNNGCADAITVKNSTGTGVAVPAGKAMLVFNNATNVVDAITHLSSLTLATALAVAQGGTGATTDSGARTNLGLGTIATQNSNSVTITGGSVTGITDIAVADGGTGASDASTARTNLGLAIGTNVQAYDADLTAIGALAKTDGNFIVGNGSTWVAESGATARTSLGLGSLATASTISNTNWSGTDLAVVNGGTGASDTATARTNLGLAIGTNVQAYDADLTAIGGLAKTDGNIIVGNGSTWVAESGATARTSLGVGTGDSPSFAGLTVDTDTLYVDAASNEVGIGTATPAYTLHVKSAQINATQIESTNASFARLIFKNANTTNTPYIGSFNNELRLNSTSSSVVIQDGATEKMRVDASGNLLFNSGYGSAATGFGCRAWVNFNGTGTVAIRGNGNVSSITDNGTGDYTVNFVTAMPDTSYAGVVSAKEDESGTSAQSAFGNPYRTAQTTSAFRILCATGASKYDFIAVFAAFFR